MKEKDYKTSVAYMLEIAGRDVEQNVAPDNLRTYQYDPAPSNLMSPKIAGGRYTVRPNAGVGSAGSGQTDGRDTRVSGLGGGIGAGIVRHTEGKSRLHDASELIDFLSEASQYGENIAKVFRQGISLTLPFEHVDATRDVLRSARISCWKFGKGMAKTGETLEAARQLCAVVQNFHAARGEMQSIITDPRYSWDVKMARMGAELTALSLKTIAQIGWEVPHQSIGYARTAAAFFGADVMHPAFDPTCSWRTWASWQGVNFMDARIGYLTEHVYDGNTIYAFIHTHVRQPDKHFSK